MPTQRDELFGRIALERGYVAQNHLDEALDVQRKAEEIGLPETLSHICVLKKFLTRDQAQEVKHAVAVETGDVRLVAGYEVVAKLGEGGMGAVYKARSLETGEYVALKILPPSLATREYVARFKQEFEIISELNHEHIVRPIDFGYDTRR